MDKIIQIIQDALTEYTAPEFTDLMLEAKKKFFELTGKLNDDYHDYENRMSSFNDWYLFHFISEKETRSVIKQYMLNKQIDAKIIKGLLDFNYSLFEFIGKKSKKGLYIKDILHKNKFYLHSNHENLSLLPGDIFVGRTICFEHQYLMLDGICLLANSVKKTFKKESEIIRKYEDKKMEYDFLIKLEFLKSKFKRYNHLGAQKIFVFDN